MKKANIGNIHVTASAFEIVSETKKSSPRSEKQGLLFGYIGVDEDNITAFETLRSLCSKESVDKIVIVYHDYAFSLVGVSLTENNKNAPSIRLGGTYKFCAKDVQLEGLPGSVTEA